MIDNRMRLAVPARAVRDQVAATQNTLRNLVKKLEEINKTDIDGDGKVG
jgi:hypothetical protein